MSYYTPVAWIGIICEGTRGKGAMENFSKCLYVC